MQVQVVAHVLHHVRAPKVARDAAINLERDNIPHPDSLPGRRRMRSDDLLNNRRHLQPHKTSSEKLDTNNKREQSEWAEKMKELGFNEFSESSS